MRVAIFGAGAVGGHLAARLAHGGVDVSIVARGAHLAAIRARGLRFVCADADFTVRVRATDCAAELGPQDLVISTVKAQALPASADALQALLGPQTPVVYAINGVPWWYFHQAAGPLAGQPLPRLDPQGRLWNGIGVERALGCVVHSANEVTAPGVVHNGSATNRFIIGEPDQSDSPRLARIVTVLRQALPDIGGSIDIRRDLWLKLLINLSASPLACLTHARSSDIAADPALRDLFRRLMAEGARVAAALGIEVPADADTPLSRMTTLHHRSSMLQDLLAGRPMEIDGQLAVVQDIARGLDVPTPTLDVLLALLIHRAREAGLYPTPRATAHAAIGNVECQP